jgi:hypothetical protein
MILSAVKVHACPFSQVTINLRYFTSRKVYVGLLIIIFKALPSPRYNPISALHSIREIAGGEESYNHNSNLSLFPPYNPIKAIHSIREKDRG